MAIPKDVKCEVSCIVMKLPPKWRYPSREYSRQESCVRSRADGCTSREYRLTWAKVKREKKGNSQATGHVCFDYRCSRQMHKKGIEGPQEGGLGERVVGAADKTGYRTANGVPRA
jgi:hypothetical protein